MTALRFAAVWIVCLAVSEQSSAASRATSTRSATMATLQRLTNNAALKRMLHRDGDKVVIASGTSRKGARHYKLAVVADGLAMETYDVIPRRSGGHRMTLVGRGIVADKRVSALVKALGLTAEKIDLAYDRWRAERELSGLTSPD